MVRLPQEQVQDDHQPYGVKAVEDLSDKYQDYTAAVRLYRARAAHQKKGRA